MGYAVQTYHGSYNVSRRTQPVSYIVVHYVGSGTSAAGSALANCRYFAGGDRQASAHYFIDDASIWEYADPATHYTWHCGDGHGRYGVTNGNSIGIEVCQNGDRPYTDAEVDRLAWLVRQLMSRFGVPASRVVRHYDASRKACPYYYTPYGSGGDAAWAALHERITSEEDELTDSDIKAIAEAVWQTADGSWTADRVYRCTSMLKAMCGLDPEYTGDPKDDAVDIRGWTIGRLERALRILKGLSGIDQEDVSDEAIGTPMHVSLSDGQVEAIAERVAELLSR